MKTTNYILPLAAFAAGALFAKSQSGASVGAVKKFENLKNDIEALGFEFHEIKYRAHGGSSTGFVITDADKNELIEVEPVHYSNGDRWMVKDKQTYPNEWPTHRGLYYLKKLKGFAKNIQLKAGHTGFRLRA